MMRALMLVALLGACGDNYRGEIHLPDAGVDFDRDSPAHVKVEPIELCSGVARAVFRLDWEVCEGHDWGAVCESGGRVTTFDFEVGEVELEEAGCVDRYAIVEVRNE